MIFAGSEAERETALEKLLPAQREDFAGLFEIMSGLPITVRLLDPPLHEFLPHSAEDMDAFAKAAGLDASEVKARLGELSEANPMLGHRGCRLGVTYPEIYAMQARAVFEGAIEAGKKTGETVEPEIMIPLVGVAKELKILRDVVDEVAKAVFEEQGQSLTYSVGTMIELPRAALTADEIAAHADFFSFGTNDLTQTTFGISRDDAGRFLPIYRDKGIVESDPFAKLDQTGVGQLVEIACEKGRDVKDAIKLGICGEHGGDPSSIAFCERTGLDYVSCSPYRVPIARLAAAQASIKLGKSDASKGAVKKAA
jgi:pyruvate,orthophosphate dikinase